MEEARRALRFTLSHPVTAAIPPGEEAIFQMALKLAAEFEPLAAAEAEAIQKEGLLGKPPFRYPSQGA